MTERANERIEQLVDDLLDSWHRWRDGDDRDLSQDLEEGIEGLIVDFNTGTLPETYRPLVRPVNELRTAWTHFLETRGRKPQPSTAVWAALEAIKQMHRRIVAPPARRPLESIATLRALAGMTDAQIVKMHRIRIPAGMTPTQAIDAEQREPGFCSRQQQQDQTVPMPTVAPADEPARALRGVFSQRGKRPAAKESIQELLATGVHGKQICTMKQITRDEMEAYCQDHNLAIPPWTPPAHDAPSVCELLTGRAEF